MPKRPILAVLAGAVIMPGTRSPPSFVLDALALSLPEEACLPRPVPDASGSSATGEERRRWQRNCYRAMSRYRSHLPEGVRGHLDGSECPD